MSAEFTIFVRVGTLTNSPSGRSLYELSGPDVFNKNEMAAILEEQLNRSVSVQEIGIEMWQEQAKNTELGDYQLDTRVQMFRYFERLYNDLIEYLSKSCRK